MPQCCRVFSWKSRFPFSQWVWVANWLSCVLGTSVLSFLVIFFGLYLIGWTNIVLYYFRNLFSINRVITLILLITNNIITIRQSSSLTASPGLYPWLTHCFWSFCFFPENNYSLVLNLRVDQSIGMTLRLQNSFDNFLLWSSPQFSFRPPLCYKLDLDH